MVALSAYQFFYTHTHTYACVHTHTHTHTHTHICLDYKASNSQAHAQSTQTYTSHHHPTHTYTLYPPPPPHTHTHTHTYLRAKGLKKRFVKRERIFKEDYDRRDHRDSMTNRKTGSGLQDVGWNHIDSMTHDEQKNWEWVAGRWMESQR